MQFWLKSGNDYFCPDSISLRDNEHAAVKFYVNSFYQDSVSSPVIDIVANDDIDGTFAFRDGVVFRKFEKSKLDSIQAKRLSRLQDSMSTALSADNGDHVTDADIWLVPDKKAKLSKCIIEVRHNKAQLVVFPYREILYESIRNTFFHVPMWFAMTALVLFSLFYSIAYLITGKIEHDVYAHQAIVAALLFGTCGLMTGSVWARYTWGQFWVNDPKLNGAAIGVVIYLAYLILRGSLSDEIKRARIAAVYNVFAIIIFLLFIFILPRLTDSLHPGNGGNPAFSKYDLDNTLRLFFYPAVIGWILLSFWILSILIRLQFIQQKRES